MKLLRHLSTKAYLIGLIIISLVMRTFLMTKADVWHDEGFTMDMVQRGFLDIIARNIRDVHPPLYYLVVHAWEKLFGMSVISIRGFSVLCGVLTVVIFYLLMRKLFTERIARIAAFFVAIGPFASRYSDEARMYAMVALLVTFASYALIVALEQTHSRSRWKWWGIYGCAVLAALYTQYYALFIIPVHVGYAWWKLGGITSLLRSKYWWTTHLGIVLCFLPWVPVIKDQVTRVQGGYWIPPVTPETIPNTFSQFLIYASSDQMFAAELLVLHLIIIAVVILAIKRPTLRVPLLFLAGWVVAPIIAVVILSLKQPVYQDRYFTYSSIAFYGILGVIVATLPRLKKKETPMIIGFVVVSCILLSGFIGVSKQAQHKMGTVGQYVTSHIKPGDTIVSAELYTYFDFNYYNHSGTTTLLLYHDPASGYGETSLLYDKPQILIHDLNQLTTSRVWVIGKTGDHDYYTTAVPLSWHLVERIEAGDSVAQLYTTR